MHDAVRARAAWACLCTSVNARAQFFGGVSAEFLTQTGHEKRGTLDCCLFTTAATRPAATQLAAIKNIPHKPRVKEIFQCVTHNLKTFLKFY